MDAPPTKTPSTNSESKMSFELDGFTLPPYKTGVLRSNSLSFDFTCS